MKKIISILTVFAMVLAFAAIPAMAADVTLVDLTTDNIALNAKVTKTFVSYGTANLHSSGSTCKDPNMIAKGNFDSVLTANTKGAALTGHMITIDLGAEYSINEVIFFTGSEESTSTYAKAVNVYGSSATPCAQAYDEAIFNSTVTLLGTTTQGAVGQFATVQEPDKVVNAVQGTLTLDGTQHARYITLYYNNKYSFAYRAVSVKGTPWVDTSTDADKVAADKEALTLGDTSAVTEKLKLPTEGNAYGSTITWATSDESVIATNGAIHRVGEDRTATLTATITNGEATDTKSFDVTVKAYDTYTLDLSAENNILLGKVVTPIVGHYYSDSKPSDTKQFATDGDLTTGHSGYGKVNNAVVGVVFSIDLEDDYLIDTLDVVIAEAEAGRAISVYNGPAVDETKLIGTYTSVAKYVVAGEQEASHSVIHCDFPQATVASQLTIAYESGYGFSYSEIAATGHAVQEGEIIRDFTSANNLAYRKDNEWLLGHFYDGSNPSTTDLATDGDITTTKRCAGKYSGDDSGSGYYGSAIRIDLGAYYNLTELTLYTTTNTSSISFRSEDDAPVTGVGNASHIGGYILNSLGGQLHTNGFATVALADAELVTVNGTEVYQYSADLSNNEQPVRYVIVHLNGGTWTYNELYVAGTPATGLAFAEGDFVYADGQVTAQVNIMNLTDAAANGNLFFAAYDAEGAVVGMTSVANVEVVAGATYNTPVTFAASAKATYVKAFYWVDGTFVPVIADIICD